MSDDSLSLSEIGDVSAVAGRQLPFDDGLAATEPIELSEIVGELEQYTPPSAPPVAA